MAYKFQIGLAKLSGSITQTDGTITALGLDNSDANATSFGDIELDSLTAESSLITINNNTRMASTSAVQFGNADTKIGGDGSGAMQIEVSGAANNLVLVHGATSNFSVKDGLNEAEVDLRMSGSKAVQFGNADTKIGGDGSGAMQIEVSGAANSLVLVHGSTSNFAVKDGLNESEVNLRMSGSSAVQFGNADTKIGGDGSGAMQIEVSGAANSLVLVHGATSNFAVKNELNESEVNLRMSGSTKVQFGGTTDHIGINAGNLEILADADINLNTAADVDIQTHDGTNGLKLAGTLVTADASEINVLDGATNANNTAGKAVILDGSGHLTLAGNLTVQGTTTTVDSTTINISSSFTFEGPADDFETTLHSGTPVQDATIYLPQISGSGAQTGYLLALANDPGTSALTATRANLDLMAAGAGSTVGLQGADGVVIFDNDDSNTPKKVLVSDITDLAGRLTVNSRADTETLTIGMNYFADLTGTQAEVTLPASPSVGDIVYVKAGDLDSSSDIAIQRAGSQTIDGATGISLESPFAAVTLVYVANNDWRIV